VPKDLFDLFSVSEGEEFRSASKDSMQEEMASLSRTRSIAPYRFQ